MPDITGPGVGDISAVNTALAELNARLAVVEAREREVLGLVQEVVLTQNRSTEAEIARVKPGGNINAELLAELNTRREIIALQSEAINQENRLSAAIERRIGIQAQAAAIPGEVVAPAPVRSTPAPVIAEPIPTQRPRPRGALGRFITPEAATVAELNALASQPLSVYQRARMAPPVEPAAPPSPSVIAGPARPSPRGALGRFITPEAATVAEINAIANQPLSVFERASIAGGGGIGGGGGGGGRGFGAGGAGAGGEDVALKYTAAQLGEQWQQNQATLSSLDNTLTRHGYLTSEVIAAAQRGELTYREWGNQIAGTAAKFGAWTAVSIPIFGALSAFKHLYDGAVQASQGVAFMQRSIDNLNVDRAKQQLETLSQHFNVTIEDAANAAGIMGRIYHSQDQAVQAALPVLYAEKLGGQNPTTYAPELAGVATAFSLPASQLQTLFGMITQAQLRFGAPIGNITQALATAGGTWAAQGGSPTQLLSLITAVSRSAGVTNIAPFATALTQVARQVQQPQNSASLAARGINPILPLPQLIEQALQRAQQQPQDATAIASALGNARIFRTLIALLHHPDIPAQAQDVFNRVGDIQGFGGPQEGELQHQLSGAHEQIIRVGVSLQNIGASLGQSGALTGLGEMLRLVNSLLGAVNELVQLFNKIPDPFRHIAAGALEVAAVLRIGRQINIGQGLSAGGALTDAAGNLTFRGRLHGLLTQDQGVLDARGVTAQARNNVVAQDASIQSLTQRSQGALLAAQSKTLEAQQLQASGQTEAAAEARLIANELQKQAILLQSELVIQAQIRAAYAQVYENVKMAATNAEKVAAFNAGIPGITGAGTRYATLPTTGSGRVTELERAAGGMVPVNIMGAGGVRGPATGGSVPIVSAEAPIGGGRTILLPTSAAESLAAAREGAAVTSDVVSTGIASKVLNGIGTGMGGVGSIWTNAHAGGAGVFGSVLTFSVGQMLAQMLGGAVGGHAGSLVSNTGTGAALGAAIGSIFPGVGTLLGGGLGALASEAIHFMGGHGTNTNAITAALDPRGSTYQQFVRAQREVQNQIHGANGLPIENPRANPGPNNLDSQALQIEARAALIHALRNPRVRVVDLPPGAAHRNANPFIDWAAIPIGDRNPNPTAAQFAGASTESVLKAGEKAIKDAKTLAQKKAALDKYTQDLSESYDALFGGAKGQTAIASATNVLRLDTAAGAIDSFGPAGFLEFYRSLDTKSTTAYDNFIKDTIGEQGLGAKAPGGQMTLFRQGILAAGAKEKDAQALMKQAGDKNLQPQQVASLVQRSDSYAKAAASLTTQILDQNNTDLQNSLAEATNPQQIGQAYRTAEANARALMKVDPQKAKAQLATFAAGYAQVITQNITAQLAVSNAQDPNTIDVANRTITAQQRILQRLQGVPGEQAYQARQQAIAAISQGEQQRLQAAQQQTQNEASLSQAQAGNNLPLADQAVVNGIQQQIAELQSSGLSARAKAQLLIPLQAQLTQARLSLYNDTADYTRNLISATQALEGDVNNNPLQIAAHQVTAAEQTLKYGHFKTTAARKQAEDTVRQTKFNQQGVDYSQLQIHMDLAHESVSQQITSLQKFLNHIGKSNIALRQQVLQQILQDETQDASTYELNVGNISLPSAYAVRRAEHALHAPHDQQGGPVMVGNVVIHVHGSHDAHATAKATVDAFHQGLKNAGRAAQRSRVLR